MTTEIITFDRLNAIIDLLTSKALSYSVPIYPLLATQKITGLRVNEVYQLDRWKKQPDGNYLVVLEKKSGNRLVRASDLPPSFLDILSAYPVTDFRFRIRQVNYFIASYIPYTALRVGNKEISTHLFRYYFCRQLHNQGWTDQQIKEVIVHSSPAVTAQYIYGDIIGFKP